MILPKTQKTRNGASFTVTPISGKGLSGKFLLLLLNARSMLRKILYIRLLTLSSNYDSIPKTKPWLKTYTPENTVICPGHKSFRKSREDQRGSGCPAYVRESRPATLCQDTMLNTIQDAVWFGVEVGDERPCARCFQLTPGSRQNGFEENNQRMLLLTYQDPSCLLEILTELA